MSDFDIEDMRYIPDPFEILEEATLPRDGLVRARILDPTDESGSVIGYDYMWNQNFSFEPTTSDKLKVVSFALGEMMCDATIAYILEIRSYEESRETHERTIEAMQSQMHQIGQDNQRRIEERLLEDKRSIARLQIIQEAELTPDAIELIRREIIVEYPDVHFPGSPMEEPGSHQG